MFNPWRDGMPSWLALRAVQLPGREDRWSEPPRHQINELVGEIAGAVAELGADPLLLYGHSLGGLLAFELTRELRRRSVEVAYLFVSASRAPHVPGPFPPMRHLPTTDLAAELSKRWDAAPELSQNPELMEILAPAIRADLELFETYRHTPEAPLTCPIFAYRGSDDTSLRPDEVDAWQSHTTAACHPRTYDGGHRFPRQVPSPLFELVVDDVLSVLGDEARYGAHLQEELAALCEEILGLDRVGTRDNFFTELGGNSLLATRLISHVRSRYGVNLPLKVFFAGPTVEEMSAALLTLKSRDSDDDGLSGPGQIRRARPTKGRLLPDGGLTVGP
jgi:surfactin synthase thioesterase subunit